MAKKPEPMTEEELAQICVSEFENSEVLMSEIAEERTRGLDYYNQEKFGNEEAGLSSYVSSDVSDVIDWIMPQLCDVFVSGDTPIMFEAQNSEDSEAADIESQYCQYVFLRQNPGVLQFITWAKDALIEKNGTIKAWWEEKEQREREEYKNKTGQEYILLRNDPEFEVKEITISLGDNEYSEEEYLDIIQSLPTQASMLEGEAKYHIIGYRKTKIGQIKTENIPPEQFFVQKDHNSVLLKDARFCGEYYYKTRSELVEMGYDRDLVDTLPSTNYSGGLITDERLTRVKKEGADISLQQQMPGSDRSRELILIFDYYIRADFNNDGVAEMRHVRCADKGSRYVLENEEVDRNIYHSITPNLRNYRFYGRSISERIFDLQRAKSQLWRNAFDNVAYSVMPRKIFSGGIDIKAAMTYVMGGLIKKDVGATFENEITPFVADSALAMADKLDAVRAERTGFSRDTMGLNPEALSNSTNFVGMSIMSQSQLLTKMIAMIFANTGYMTLMEHIRELVQKYEHQDRIFDLTGKTLNTDPRGWRKKRNAITKVGIGSAGKMEELSILDKLIGLQTSLIQAQGGIEGPLTNAKGIFNTINRLCQRMGVKDAANYFTDPTTYQPPQPQPSLAEVQLKASIDKMNNDQKITEAKMRIDAENSKMSHEIKMAELTQDERLEMKKIEVNERLKEQELIYKYGKDANDRHHSAHDFSMNRFMLLKNIHEEKEEEKD